MPTPSGQALVGFFIMDDDYELVMSPLNREITMSNTTINVLIYRGPNDQRWTLEVEDERGGSTVWSDPFLTDEEALDEVLRVIEEDGIACFSFTPSKKLN